MGILGRRGLVAQLPIHGYGIVTADRYRCQAIPRFNLSSQIKEPRSWAVVQQDPIMINPCYSRKSLLH
jgi:hypothetical protein